MEELARELEQLIYYQECNMLSSTLNFAQLKLSVLRSPHRWGVPQWWGQMGRDLPVGTAIWLKLLSCSA